MTEPLEGLIDSAYGFSGRGGAGMRLALQRRSDFSSRREAELTGMLLDPRGREYVDLWLDEHFRADKRAQDKTLTATKDAPREVIIGSGFHAAVYAATRVKAGFARPLVLEREKRPGGIFAMTEGSTWYLNSRNRDGGIGLSRDRGANLNYLPGAPIQTAAMSMSQYQTNVEIARGIRLTLAEYADVVPNAKVMEALSAVEVVGDTGRKIVLEDRPDVYASRIIDARGLGDPKTELANGTSVLDYRQFMTLMNKPWPLRGLRRVAVVGDGNGALTVIESLLGLAPEPRMAAASLDAVERIDVFGPRLPVSCAGWLDQVRSRYQAISPYLRADRFGIQRLNVFQKRATPIALPDGAIIEGTGYDLVVMATGFRETEIPGLSQFGMTRFAGPDGNVIARKDVDGSNAYRVGPHADLGFESYERDAGTTSDSENRVSMFRLGSKTATLAVMLLDVDDERAGGYYGKGIYTVPKSVLTREKKADPAPKEFTVGALVEFVENSYTDKGATGTIVEVADPIGGESEVPVKIDGKISGGAYGRGIYTVRKSALKLL